MWTTRPYAWSLRLSDLDVSSDHGREGLYYAQELARGQATGAELATSDSTSTGTIYRRIRQMKLEVFGRDDLSERTMRYRVQIMERRGGRVCAHPGCSRRLARSAHGNQRYCRRHGRPVWRTWRSRER
jgi:hypothetical protein